MKAVILAGGFGTRMNEETLLLPKPMIEIGGRPILWHIMKIYSHYGFDDFIICLGYKGNVIRDYFASYFLHNSDVTFDLTKNNAFEIHRSSAEPWRVTLVDTGYGTMTGGRLKRIQPYLNDERFFMTYGDGLSNVDLPALLAFHNASHCLATITATQPGGKFGVLEISEDNKINTFREKSLEDGGWINGGFMVLEPGVFDYIEGDSTIFELEPMESLARDGQLCAYKHYGYWKCMDAQRDRDALEALWKSKEAPWKLW